ncbi:MAG: acetyltransferase [Acetobacterales bacterium]
MTTVVMVALDKDLLEQMLLESALTVAGIFDPGVVESVLGVPPLGGDAEWAGWAARYPEVKALLAADPPLLRLRLAATYGPGRLAGFRSPLARLSPQACIGADAVIQADVFVSAGVVVGSLCKLNVGAALHHDVRLGDCCTVAPGARLLGRVSVGNGVYVGAGAMVLPNLSVGDGATIGAGAVVTSDVPAGATVAGVPARPLPERVS